MPSGQRRQQIFPSFERQYYRRPNAMGRRFENRELDLREKEERPSNLAPGPKIYIFERKNLYWICSWICRLMIMSKDLDSFLSDMKTVHEDLKPIFCRNCGSFWGVTQVPLWLPGIWPPFLLPTFCSHATGNEAGSFGVKRCRADQDPGSALS
jgi:hypothetical protein